MSTYFLLPRITFTRTYRGTVPVDVHRITTSSIVDCSNVGCSPCVVHRIHFADCKQQRMTNRQVVERTLICCRISRLHVEKHLLRRSTSPHMTLVDLITLTRDVRRKFQFTMRSSEDTKHDPSVSRLDKTPLLYRRSVVLHHLIYVFICIVLTTTFVEQC